MPNNTTIDTTSVSCSSIPYFPLPIAERLSPEFRDVFIIRIAVNALSCPFVVLLNILVMVAVKTNRQLCTKSNVSLACLATTDLVVGLVVQGRIQEFLKGGLYTIDITFITNGVEGE